MYPKKLSDALKTKELVIDPHCVEQYKAKVLQFRGKEHWPDEKIRHSLRSYAFCLQFIRRQPDRTYLYGIPGQIYFLIQFTNSKVRMVTCYGDDKYLKWFNKHVRCRNSPKIAI